MSRGRKAPLSTFPGVTVSPQYFRKKRLTSEAIWKHVMWHTSQSGHTNVQNVGDRKDIHTCNRDDIYTHFAYVGMWECSENIQIRYCIQRLHKWGTEVVQARKDYTCITFACKKMGAGNTLRCYRLIKHIMCNGIQDQGLPFGCEWYAFPFEFHFFRVFKATIIFDYVYIYGILSQESISKKLWSEATRSKSIPLISQQMEAFRNWKCRFDAASRCKPRFHGYSHWQIPRWTATSA